ncbi:kinase-like domain-containing protein [Rhizophagus clarus]|nr:kinase-like domain-containing protein [Rhizophagus clarus]
MELITLQQKNSQFEQDIQDLKFNLNVKIKEFVEKENTLQTQITLTDNLFKQLEQNKLINQQFQIQINQLNQEKNNLQDQLNQKETNVQEYKNQLIYFQNNYKQIEDENLKLEKIAKIYYQVSQNELVNLQQKNSQFEQDNQNLKFDLTTQIEEFAEKENTLQIQIDQLKQEKIGILQDQKLAIKKLTKLEKKINYLEPELNNQEQINQNLKLDLAKQIKEFADKENTLQTQISDLQNEIYEKEALTSNLTKQLKQNKLTNQKVQFQIDQLEQEKINLQKNLSQIETNIQELEFLQENLFEQKEQLEIKLNQSQINYEQLEQEKINLHNMMVGILQDQKLTDKLKFKLTKLKKEINQLEQKLNNEKQIKEQLTQALHIKDDKINELEQKLINLDNERIKKLKDKSTELNEIKKELIIKLSSGENTKEVHKEREAKEKEMNELKQELLRTSASYNVNRKKQVFNQVNNFMKSKDNFLTLREEAIEKLQNCYNHLESSINKERVEDKYTKEFQNILVKYNDGLLKLNKGYNSLMNFIQKNKELKVTIKINNILKLESFNIDRYNIFKFATNFQEGNRIKLNSSMMAEDIKSLKKNLDELKAELEQEEKELKNLK